MKPSFVVTVLFLSQLTGCGGGDKEENLGDQTAAVITDTRVLKEAQGAANEIIRNAADCEFVKSNIADVNQRLDEAERNVRTETGRVTLGSLRKQVKTIAEACGAL